MVVTEQGATLDRLLGLLAERRVNRRRLAVLTGFGGNYVYMMLRGERPLNRKFLLACERELGVPRYTLAKRL